MSFFTTSALIIVEPKISRNPCQYTTMHPEISVILKSARTARDRPEQPGAGGAARVLEITPVVLEYCLNRIFVEIIMEYDAKWGLTRECKCSSYVLESAREYSLVWCKY